jgi:hypothetical protein
MEISLYLHKVPERYRAQLGYARAETLLICAVPCPCGPAIGGRNINLSLKVFFALLSLSLQGRRTLI